MVQKPNINVIDIARLSGVSRSTVSRVINKHPNVKDSTRKQVLKIVEQYNFKPNPAARALVSQRTNVIGILIPHVVSDLFADPFFPTLIQAITTTANDHHYSVMIWLTSSEVDKNTFYNQVLEHRITDGLIIASAVIDDYVLHKLETRGKRFVIIGRPNIGLEHINFVDVESQKGLYMMVKHMIGRGHRRIGFIPGLESLTSSQDRQRGYQLALQEAGIALDEALIGPSGNFREQGGYESMNYLLKRNVDAVCASSDTMAIGAMRAVQEAGLSVPHDVAIGGFDDMPFAAVSNPPLTTIRQPIPKLGERAVVELIAVLENHAYLPSQEILPVELIVRQST